MDTNRQALPFSIKESNLCKGIAIILMLFHHLFNDYEEYAGYVIDYSPFTPERLTLLALIAKICVAIFVFISGYGITASYNKNFKDEKPGRREIGRFIWSRYWKLMTAYWFIFALTLICQPLGRTITDAYGHNPKEIVLYFFMDFFGLSYLFSTPTLNPTWWYMSIAICIILFMPFIINAMQRMGAIPFVAASTFFLYFAGLLNPSTFYWFSLVLGAACCQINLFSRVSLLSRKSQTAVLCLELCLFFFLLSLRTNYNFNGLIDGFIALVLALLTHSALIYIPLLSDLLQLLGRHSANIFMLHNQLYSFYFLGFFYSFRHWAIILAVLTVISLLLSVLIERLKRKTPYSRLMSKAGMALERRFYPLV